MTTTTRVRVTTTISITVLLFLFNITLSRARDLQNPLPETTTRSHSSSKTEPHDTVLFNLNSIDHVPLNLLDFRPINRHIHPHQLTLPLDFPLSHRRCRHGHRRQIRYGNDMILTKDADRRIPKRLAKIHGGEVKYRPMMMTYKDVIRREEEEEEERRHHDENGWFEKKIHQFFNLF